MRGTRTRARARTRAALVALLGWSLALGTTPSLAAGGGASGASGSDMSVSGVVNNCRMFANRRSYGVDCATGGVDPGLTLREVLGGDELPECWDDLLPEDEAAAMELETPHEGHGRWIVTTCLTGIDPTTLVGQARFTRTIQWVPDGWELRLLTANQRALVRGQNGCGRLEILLLAQPTPRPRVGQQVAFRAQPLGGVCQGPLAESDDEDQWVVGLGDNQAGSLVDDLDGDPDTAGPISASDTDGVGVRRMRARVVGVEVSSEPGRLDCTCEGEACRITPTATRATAPGACWAVFDRSSASQKGNAYRMRVFVTWQIEYCVAACDSGRDAWQTWRRVTRTYPAALPVTEIQTLVVP